MCVYICTDNDWFAGSGAQAEKGGIKYATLVFILQRIMYTYTHTLTAHTHTQRERENSCLRMILDASNLTSKLQCLSCKKSTCFRVHLVHAHGTHTHTHTLFCKGAYISMYTPFFLQVCIHSIYTPFGARVHT
jgi:hypothetical protein